MWIDLVDNLQLNQIFYQNKKKTQISSERKLSENRHTVCMKNIGVLVDWGFKKYKVSKI